MSLSPPVSLSPCLSLSHPLSVCIAGPDQFSDDLQRCWRVFGSCPACCPSACLPTQTPCTPLLASHSTSACACPLGSHPRFLSCSLTWLGPLEGRRPGRRCLKNCFFWTAWSGWRMMSWSQRGSAVSQEATRLWTGCQSAAWIPNKHQRRER